MVGSGEKRNRKYTMMNNGIVYVVVSYVENVGFQFKSHFIFLREEVAAANSLRIFFASDQKRGLMIQISIFEQWVFNSTRSDFSSICALKDTILI